MREPEYPFSLEVFMKSVLLIGLNSFGTLIAKQLYDLGHQVMAVDRNESRVNALLPIVTDAQIGDSTNEAFLRSLGIPGYDVCIVTIGGDFQSSLETTALLKELGGRMVVSRADSAEWAAIRYASNHILDYIRLDDDHAIYEVTVPSEWIGKTIGQIDIRKHFGITIMAVKKNGRMILSVTPETMLKKGITMLVLGEYKAMQRCFHI